MTAGSYASDRAPGVSEARRPRQPGGIATPADYPPNSLSNRGSASTLTPMYPPGNEHLEISLMIA